MIVTVTTDMIMTMREYMREYKEVHINYISQTLGTLLLLAALKYTRSTNVE